MTEKRTARPWDAGLLVDKVPDLTSHDVVARVRQIVPVKKCGHTGTLDPFATGLLVLCLGRATRLARFVSAQPKSYVALVRFGFATDTFDRTGKPLGEDSRAFPSEAALRSALSEKLGPQQQIPPPFSAKKIQGRRAYALARAGKEVTPDAVSVEVYELAIEELAPPLARLRLRVSSGTYVRSLAHDLGQSLGVGAHLEALRRTAVGSLRVEEAVTLDALRSIEAQGRLSERLLEPNQLLEDLPSAPVTEAEARALSHGRDVPGGLDGEGTERPFRLLDTLGRLVAVCEAREGQWHPLVVWARPGDNS